MEANAGEAVAVRYRARQTRLERASRVEGPVLRVGPNVRREAVCVGWAHAGAAERLIGAAAGTAACDRPAVLRPVPLSVDRPTTATRETPCVRPIHESRGGRQRASPGRRWSAALAASGERPSEREQR